MFVKLGAWQRAHATGVHCVTKACALQITMEELNVIDKLPHYCPVCAYHEWNLDGLVEMIWEYIDVLRIYTKPKVRLVVWYTLQLLTHRDLLHNMHQPSGVHNSLCIFELMAKCP